MLPAFEWHTHTQHQPPHFPPFNTLPTPAPKQATPRRCCRAPTPPSPRKTRPRWRQREQGVVGQEVACAGGGGAGCGAAGLLWKSLLQALPQLGWHLRSVCPHPLPPRLTSTPPYPAPLQLGLACSTAAWPSFSPGRVAWLPAGSPAAPFAPSREPAPLLRVWRVLQHELFHPRP